jgi:HK97 family phage portal protein
MEWNPLNWFQKNNPAQERISQEAGSQVSTDQNISYIYAFDKLESVNRGTNMITSACASLNYDIKDKVLDGIVVGVRSKQLNNLLNYRPNPYQSIQDFRTAIFTDFVLEGNIFIYWDGAFMYHLPANKMVVVPDPKTFVLKYTYNNITEFSADEVFHIRDLSATSIYRGTSRLVSAKRSIDILYRMQTFQDLFFENGAVTGLVLETENTLSQLAKDKTIEKWRTQYSPKNGAKKPIILDSGLKLKSMSTASFKDMDFDVSIQTHDTKVLKALGIPPILLDGGNNANIAPNLRLLYLETVLPIVTKFTSALERFFGYDIEPITSGVSALQPDIKDVAAYHSTLVNAGILTPNEARIELRYPKVEGSDEIRIPANIAGSAANPSEGGKPKDKPPATGK